MQRLTWWIAAGIFPLATLEGSGGVDTFAVRLGHAAPPLASGPASALDEQSVGNTYCYAQHCIVYAGTLAQGNALRALEAKGLVTLEPLPDAHRVFFQHSTFDAQSGSFNRDFPGRLDSPVNGESGLFAVVFKSFPERAWLDELEHAGAIALEPIQTMAYYVYGPRAMMTALPKTFGFIYAVSEIPAGIKRFHVDFRSAGDDDGPSPTVVAVVAAKRDLVLGLLRSAAGKEPSGAYRTGPVEAFTAELSREDALSLSALPEVVFVERETQGAPSDERSSRIIGGTWQAPGTSWPLSLGGNNGVPHYWDDYLSQLGGLGLSLNNQTIGFLDTGADSGLQRGQAAYCPPYLRPPGYPADPCRLVFTTDVTQGFSDLETRADDYYYHGTMTTSIAAGFSGTASSGRDTNGYAFTQGVGQNAKIAMCKIFRACTQDPQNRRVGEAQPFSDYDVQQKTRYALVELSASGLLPDGVTGPGARIFNHSWNSPPTLDPPNPPIFYDSTSLLLDQTTRLLSTAAFTFDGNQTVSGASAPGLHVVSAGNYPDYWAGSREVLPPATAKNVITVGATETYNQEAYAPGCGNNNSDNADNPLQLTGFTRIGYPNLRLKPDVVAPGTRSYGRRSVEWTNCSGACNTDLDGTQQYAWSSGTSFSAPAVTGAAAIVTEWIRVLRGLSPSPALVKATLIGTARTVTRLPVCGVGCGTCCAYCGDVRPAPDKYQGFGGVALDELFRPSSSYYFYDQGTTFTQNSQYWAQSLTIADVSRDINLALVWTDRASAGPNDSSVNLVNDLDLTIVIFSGGQGYTWYGNSYYTTIDSCSRDGYSLRNPSPVTYDRKNNVERINIKATDIPLGATAITVYVSAFSLTGDGINPGSPVRNQQDFAVMVENAHQ